MADDRRRSSTFFVSDVESAADDCARAVADHGLDFEETDALAVEVRETVERFFARRGEGGS